MVGITCVMQNYLKVIVCAFLVLCTTSCATMFPGNNEIAVSSTKGPLLIRVSDNGGMNEEFKTPFTFRPNRFRDVTLTVVSDEYESEQYYIPKKMRIGMFLLDLLITPFAAGLLVDFGSGKIYEHNTKHFIIHNDDLVRKKAQAIIDGLDKFKAIISVTIVGVDDNKKENKMSVEKELMFMKKGEV